MSKKNISLERVLEVAANSAQSLGVEAYLVGGFVRDQLLGILNKDIDIVVVGGKGDLLLQHIAQELKWSEPVVFERFGTAHVRGDNFILEAVQARSESYDPNSRKPNVKPGTLKEDIFRRDFTVNSLCQRLGPNLEIVDLTGHGLDDLKQGILRTPLDPNETFSEDPLRMWRAARFVSKLGFTLAEDILPAMRNQAARTSIVSVERKTEELKGLLIGKYPSRGLEVLREGNLLEITIPEIQKLVGVTQNQDHHKFDVYNHTINALDQVAPDLTTRLAMLFHDIGKPDTKEVDENGKITFYSHEDVGAEITRKTLSRLRFSDEEVQNVSTLVALHMRPMLYNPKTHSMSAVRRLVRDAGPLVDPLLEISRGDMLASRHPSVETLEALKTQMAKVDFQQIQPKVSLSPLSGIDIMKFYKAKSGVWVGQVKALLEEAVIEGEINTGDAKAARNWLKTHKAEVKKVLPVNKETEGLG